MAIVFILRYAGEEHDDTSEEDEDDNEDNDDEEEQEEVVFIIREVFESLESFSLRQIEQTPGDCWCFECFLHMIIVLGFFALLIC